MTENLEIQLGYDSLKMKSGDIVETKKRNIMFSDSTKMLLPSYERLVEIGVANAYLIPFKTLIKNGFKQVNLEDISEMSENELKFIMLCGYGQNNINRVSVREEKQFLGKTIPSSRINRVGGSFKYYSYPRLSANIISPWYKEFSGGEKLYIFAVDERDFTKNILEWSDPCIKKVFDNNEVLLRADNVKYLIEGESTVIPNLKESICQLHDVSYATKCSRHFWNNLKWWSYLVYPDGTHVGLDNLQLTFFDSYRIDVDDLVRYFHEGFDGFEIVMKDVKELYSEPRLSGVSLSVNGFWGRLLRFIKFDGYHKMESRWKLPINTCDLLKFAPLRLIVALINIIRLIGWQRDLHKDHRNVIEVPYNFRFFVPLFWNYQFKKLLAFLMKNSMKAHNKVFAFNDSLHKRLKFDTTGIVSKELDTDDVIDDTFIKKYRVLASDGVTHKYEYFGKERAAAINYTSSILLLIVLISSIFIQVPVFIFIMPFILDISISTTVLVVFNAILLFMQFVDAFWVFLITICKVFSLMFKYFYKALLLFVMPFGALFGIFTFKIFKRFKKSQGVCLDDNNCEVPQRKELIWRIFMDIKEKTCTLVEWK